MLFNNCLSIRKMSKKKNVVHESGFESVEHALTRSEQYIEENKLTWINGWDPERSSHFDFYYNVQSTPMIYILNRDKKIIAKKLAVENIGPFIENYRKFVN